MFFFNPKYTFCKEFNSEYRLWVLLRWRQCDVIYNALATEPSRRFRYFGIAEPSRRFKPSWLFRWSY